MADLITPSVSVDVLSVVERYPAHIIEVFKLLRTEIYALALQSEADIVITEKLSWNTPSYKSSKGSPIRFDYDPAQPDALKIYFICTTSLVATFRQLFANSFSFEKNRALVLDTTQPLPFDALKICFHCALHYKLIRHLPLLGQ